MFGRDQNTPLGILLLEVFFPAGNYMFKVNNTNIQQGVEFVQS